MKTSEMIKIMQHYDDGGIIETTDKVDPEESDWVECEYPIWDWMTTTYRIAKTMPSIDWSLISEEYKWLAKDAIGAGWVYQHIPFISGNDPFNVWTVSLSRACEITPLKSYNKGNVDWKESLVKRPE